MKRRIALTALAVLLTGALATLAEKPAHNVSAERHPTLAAAQHLSDQAFRRILDAQHANEWDLGGHAARAKELLEQANAELKLAAEASNEHHGK